MGDPIGGRWDLIGYHWSPIGYRWDVIVGAVPVTPQDPDPGAENDDGHPIRTAVAVVEGPRRQRRGFPGATARER